MLTPEQKHIFSAMKTYPKELALIHRKNTLGDDVALICWIDDNDPVNLKMYPLARLLSNQDISEFLTMNEPGSVVRYEPLFPFAPEVLSIPAPQAAD
jgi:hypothetical protein